MQDLCGDYNENMSLGISWSHDNQTLHLSILRRRLVLNDELSMFGNLYPAFIYESWSILIPIYKPLKLF